VRILTGPEEHPARHTVHADRLPGIAIAIGLCLLVVSTANLTLLWYAPRIGVTEWELAATTGTFDRLPLLLLGLFLLGGGSAARGLPRSARMVGWGFFLTGAGVVGTAALYALALPQALAMLPSEVGAQLRVSAVKNAVTVTAYVVTSVVCGWALLRSVHRIG